MQDLLGRLLAQRANVQSQPFDECRRVVHGLGAGGEILVVRGEQHGRERQSLGEIAAGTFDERGDDDARQIAAASIERQAGVATGGAATT